MPVRDLRLQVRPSDDELRVEVAVIGISKELEDEFLGRIRLDVHEGFLQIEIDREEEKWTGPIGTMIG